jgi:uncharacterized membrane protein
VRHSETQGSLQRILKHQVICQKNKLGNVKGAKISGNQLELIIVQNATYAFTRWIITAHGLTAEWESKTQSTSSSLLFTRGLEHFSVLQ